MLGGGFIFVINNVILYGRVVCFLEVRVEA